MRRVVRSAALIAGALLLFGTAHAGGSIAVSFDIKPTSCPNPFNPPQDIYFTETVPTAILGTGEFDTRNVQASSLVLIVPGGGGLGYTAVYPTAVGYADVATPVNDPTYCACTEEGPDGFEDLRAQFDADDIAAALGDVWRGQRIPLCIEGLLLDGRPFRGCDCIVIVGPISVDANTWGRTKATYR